MPLPISALPTFSASVTEAIVAIVFIILWRQHHRSHLLAFGISFAGIATIISLLALEQSFGPIPWREPVSDAGFIMAAVLLLAGCIGLSGRRVPWRILLTSGVATYLAARAIAAIFDIPGVVYIPEVGAFIYGGIAYVFLSRPAVPGNRVLGYLFAVRSAVNLPWLWALASGYSAYIHTADEIAIVTIGWALVVTELARATQQAEIANAELQQSEQRFRDYAETASDWFWESGPTHEFTYFSQHNNPTDVELSHLFGKCRWDTAADVESEPEKWREHRRCLDQHKSFRDYVYQIRHSDGKILYVFTSGKPVFDSAGRFFGYRGGARDVTDRVAAETRVRQLSLAVEQSPAGIAIVDPAGVIIYANQVFQEITGLAENAVGTGVTNVLPNEYWRQITAAAEDGGIGRGEVSARRSALEPFWATVSIAAIQNSDGTVAHFIVTLEDITQRKTQEREREELQSRLQEAGKMEAIGRLAGGIAHDFNNLLGTITGFASFLAEDLRAGTSDHDFATRILTACGHAKVLVAQILAFARVGQVERRPMDIRTVLRDSSELLHGALPSTATLDFAIADEALPIRANSGELSQLIVNLCLNAKDALDGAPGSVAVTVARARHGDERDRPIDNDLPTPSASRAHIAVGRLVEDRDYVRISVADTGTGIDPAILPKIFEPFFTTKDHGRGTGLGLAAVHGIVTSYGGAYSVETALGRGTTFTIYLPLITSGKSADSVSVLSDARGREHILLVDDDEDLTAMLSIGLKRLGYDVAVAQGADEALQIFGTDPRAWDVMVSDQTMRGMTGISLIDKIKALRPDLAVILCTGFSDGTTEPLARKLGADCLLKPFEPQELAARIRILLDHPGIASADHASTRGVG